MVSAKLGGEQGTVILQLDTSAYHALNEVGSLIWELLEEGMEVDELVRRVGARFAERPHRLSIDLDEFLAELAERDLVTFGPAA